MRHPVEVELRTDELIRAAKVRREVEVSTSYADAVRDAVALVEGAVRQGGGHLTRMGALQLLTKLRRLGKGPM